jgi:hypothetical protein
MTYPGKVEDQHHVIKRWQQKMKEPARTVQTVMNCWVSQSVIGGQNNVKSIFRYAHISTTLNVSFINKFDSQAFNY